ncbi:MAG: MFS transporter [Deltaproteobacteria bacterium]|nr:MAG: MFS transporter [Deltaproteobacteria bacterium]
MLWRNRQIPSPRFPRSDRLCPVVPGDGRRPRQPGTQRGDHDPPPPPEDPLCAEGAGKGTRASAGEHSPLRNRAFLALWLSTWFSAIASSMQTAAVGWLVYALTKAPMKLGVVTALRMGPSLLLLLLGGVLADRYGRRRMLIAGQGLLLLVTLLFTGHLSGGGANYLFFCLLNVAAGLAAAWMLPSRRALVPELCEDSLRGMVLLKLAQNVSWLVGPPLAGVLIERWRPVACFGLQALFIAVAFLLLFTLPPGVDRGGDRNVWEALKRGIGFARQSPDLGWLFFLMAVVSTLSLGGLHTFMPLLARDVLGMDAIGFGTIMAALSLGMISGAFLVIRFRQVRTGHWFIGSIFAGTVAFYGLTLARKPFFSFGWFAIYGIIAAIFDSSSLTLAQRLAPGQMQARITSIYLLIFLGSGFLGNLWAGFLCHALGPVSAALTMIPLVPLAALFTLYRHRRIWNLE